MNPRNVGEYIRSFLQIKTKAGEMAPLALNTAQKRLYAAVKEQQEAGKPVRCIILKARQMGFSTMIQAMFYAQAAANFHVSAMTLAHTDVATANLYAMARRYYEYSPPEVRPMVKASNGQELIFDRPTRAPDTVQGLGSRLKYLTAGGRGVGRSETLRLVHMSEFAFWPGSKRETYIGIMQAVPDLPGTMVFIESTANGYDEFKTMWDEAVDAWNRGDREGLMPVFFPWFEMEEYRRPVPEGFQPTGEERKLAEQFGLDEEQIAWRRWCIAVNCGGSEELFRQEYPATPDEAFRATGNCAFDKGKLIDRREQLRKAGTTWEYGEFAFDYDGLTIRRIRWEPRKDGIIRICRHPERDAPYVIGGDTAGTGSDKFTGQVLDNRTGAQVAVLEHRTDETRYTRQMYCLGRYYNDALVAVETNYSTYPVKELERLGYQNLFVRLREDSFTGQIIQAFGFETTTTTRQLIIDNLAAVTRQEPEVLGDDATIGEMLSFVYDQRYKPQAEAGAHDDLVMALAIAHYIRPQAPMVEAKHPEAGTAHWSADMWEDYNRADRKTRELLLEAWGRPKQR